MVQMARRGFESAAFRLAVVLHQTSENLLAQQLLSAEQLRRCYTQGGSSSGASMQVWTHLQVHVIIPQV